MSIKHVPIIAKLFCFVISIAMDFIISRKKKRTETNKAAGNEKARFPTLHRNNLNATTDVQ